MSFLKSISFAGFLIGMATAAQAELIICNQTAFTQSVSVAYEGDDDWVSEGWWNIEPSGCSTVIGGDLQNRYYYYRAEIDGGPFNGGGFYFCTTPSEYFIPGAENCAQDGYDSEDFAEIDIGETYTQYTLTLVP